MDNWILIGLAAILSLGLTSCGTLNPVVLTENSERTLVEDDE